LERNEQVSHLSSLKNLQCSALVKPKFYASSFLVACPCSKCYQDVANVLRGNRASAMMIADHLILPRTEPAVIRRNAFRLISSASAVAWDISFRGFHAVIILVTGIECRTFSPVRRGHFPPPHLTLVARCLFLCTKEAYECYY